MQEDIARRKVTGDQNDLRITLGSNDGLESRLGELDRRPSMLGDLTFNLRVTPEKNLTFNIFSTAAASPKPFSGIASPTAGKKHALMRLGSISRRETSFLEQLTQKVDTTIKEQREDSASSFFKSNPSR